jgi:hypothetical protein
MAVNVVKMYACTMATPISKNVNTKRIAIGNIFTRRNISPINSIDQLKPTITFNKVCPANILAKSRTERLPNLKV